MALSAGEQLAGKIVAKATGENTDAVLAQMEGAPQLIGASPVGLDPGTLSAILDIVLGFIMKLMDKFREGGLCIKQSTVIGPDGKERVVMTTLSEQERADALVAELRNPRRRIRARTYVDLQENLKGTPADPWDHTVAVFNVGGDPANENLVRQSVHEGEAPDYGWT